MSKQGEILFFSSFEDEADYERNEAIKLSPIQRLQYMRQLINLAYSLPNGKMPDLPTEHSLTIVQHEYFR